MITPTHHEKMEWARMANEAYRNGHNWLGHRLSSLAALPTGARIDHVIFDTVQNWYRAWLVDNAYPNTHNRER